MLEAFKTIFKVFKKGKNKETHIEDMIGDVDKILTQDRVITPGEQAREQEEFKKNPMENLALTEKISLIPILMKNMIQLKKSYQGLEQIPQKDNISKKELEIIEDKARKLGVDAIGYTKVKRDDIFLKRGILYPYALVFSIAMDKDDIETAPSYKSLHMIQETYAQTGIIANKLTNLLREMGFGAQAGPGLGGLTLYPVLARRAGLGVFGRHGLLITPENGPTHRLGVVYTNITNLSLNEDNEYEWIKDFCQQCGKCISACPSNAIYKEPVKTKGDNVAFIDTDKCLKYFKSYGCSICVKECPFNQIGYQKIKEGFLTDDEN